MKLWLYALAATSAIVAPASAERYVVVRMNLEVGSMMAIDVDTIKEVGGYKRAWLTSVVGAVKAVNVYSNSLMVFDCAEERTKIATTKLYDFKGSEVGEGGATEWTYPGPNTVNELAMQYACGKKVEPDLVVPMTAQEITNAFLGTMADLKKPKR